MPEITPDFPPLDDVIRLYVLAICIECGWNLTRTADVLRVSTKTVYNHLNRYEQAGFVVKNPTGSGWRLKEGSLTGC